MSVPVDDSLRLQGHYAGIVSRLAAFIIDVFTIAVVFALTGRVVEYIVTSVDGTPFTLSEAPVVSTIVLIAWAFFYCAYPLAVAGRTFGMAVLGLRAVRQDGGHLGNRQAVIRVLAFPLSFLLFGFGFLLILINRDRRALHDLIARTSVVYAWDARAARLRFLARPESR